MKISSFALSLSALLFTGELRADEKTFRAEEAESTIVLWHGDNAVVTYHKADVPPPEGIDPVYTRSGFLHPVKTPAGGSVTGIHPTDHYHHLGLWHAWVKCEHDGKPVDFWNLKKKEGAVRYEKTLAIVSEADHAGFTVEQDHVAYKGENKTEPVIVLNEAFSVTARLVDGAYEIDYETAQTNVSDHALKLPAYRYGGPIAYRSPLHWNGSNSDYLSSEGKTRIDGHETRSKWCAMWGPAGESGNDSSITILCHEDNHDFPQRMRVWPPNTNDGAIFFNYVPIQETGWAIEPGQKSVMRYRLVVEDRKPDPKALNARWERFSEK